MAILEKLTNWRHKLAFLFLTVGFVICCSIGLSFYVKDFSKKCLELSSTNQYEQVISKCALFSAAVNSDLNFIVGESYYRLQAFDQAAAKFETVSAADAPKAHYFLALIEINNKNYTAAFNRALGDSGDILMLNIFSMVFVARFNQSNQINDLIKGYAYSQAIAELTTTYPQTTLNEKALLKTVTDFHEEVGDLARASMSQEQFQQANTLAKNLMNKLVA